MKVNILSKITTVEYYMVKKNVMKYILKID